MSDNEHGHHGASVGTYFAVYMILVILLGATLGVAYLHLGIFSNLVALLIASVKAWTADVRPKGRCQERPLADAVCNVETKALLRVGFQS